MHVLLSRQKQREAESDCEGVTSQDVEIGRAFQKLLERQGIKFMFSTKVVGSQKSNENDEVTLELGERFADREFRHNI